MGFISLKCLFSPPSKVTLLSGCNQTYLYSRFPGKMLKETVPTHSLLSDLLDNLRPFKGCQCPSFS